MKRALTWISGPLLAAFFLWLAFRGTDLDRLSASLRGASIPLLCVAMATVVIHMALRAMRWRVLLPPTERPVPYGELFSAVTVGYMASLLPGRVGEVLRPALLARRTTVPLPPALATIAVERVLLDMLGILGCGALGLLMPAEWSGLGRGADPATLARLRLAGVVLLVGTVAGAALAIAVARRADRLEPWLAGRAAALRSALARAVAGFAVRMLPGLGGLATLRGVARLLLETATIWLIITAGTHAGIVACGVPLAPGATLVLIPMLALGIAIPTPGGAGGYHWVMKLGLTKLFGVADTAALSAALLVHAACWLPIIVLGGFLILRGALRRPDDAAGAVGGAAGVTP